MAIQQSDREKRSLKYSKFGGQSESTAIKAKLLPQMKRKDQMVMIGDHIVIQY